MNYEEKLREIINSNSEYYPSEDKDVFAKYFPELKESKDKKMIQRLKSCVYAADITSEGRKELIAWLEKKKQKLEESEVSVTESQPQPRFKEGDWIIDGRLTCKVLGVTCKSYDLHLHNDDYCHFETDIQTVDKYYRLWTIGDAKDGDVLVDEDNNIGIYVGKNDDFWHSCIYLGCDGCLHGINIGAYHKHKNTKPATKEQHDMLFRKMKEEGYEWDGEKKEVKKPIDEVKPRFKEGDFIMNNDITEDGKPEIFKIIKVCSSWYDVENVYDGRQTMITFSQDYTCHLWTIDDAKQGDILMVDDEFIVILYRKMTDGTERKDTSILTEYEYDINDNTFTKGSHLFYCDICPATYTQREVLTNYIQQVLNWEK